MTEELTVFRKEDFHLEDELIYRFLIALPPNYQKQPNQKWPLIVFLHGESECGDDLEKTKKFGIPRMLAVYDKWRNGKVDPNDLITKDYKPQSSYLSVDSSSEPVKKVNLDTAKFVAENFITAIPQAGENEYSPDLIVAFVDYLEKNFNIDTERIYLTGVSDGGHHTLETAIAYPHRFAAIAPISGGTPKIELQRIKHLPTWIFHGELDEVVPVQNALKIYEILDSFEGNATIKVFPDAYHDAFTQAYNMPELYEWFLTQKRHLNASP